MVTRLFPFRVGLVSTHQNDLVALQDGEARRAASLVRKFLHVGGGDSRSRHAAECRVAKLQHERPKGVALRDAVIRDVAFLFERHQEASACSFRELHRGRDVRQDGRGTSLNTRRMRRPRESERFCLITSCHSTGFARCRLDVAVQHAWTQRALRRLDFASIMSRDDLVCHLVTPSESDGNVDGPANEGELARGLAALRPHLGRFARPRGVQATRGALGRSVSCEATEGEASSCDSRGRTSRF